MKRFLLFAGTTYYACGGWADFIGAYDSVELAVAVAGNDYDWFHVIDSATGEVAHPGDPMNGHNGLDRAHC